MEPIRLGPFALEIPLARGGMGEVWRARHPASGARVAIKVLPAAASPAVHAALDAEIRAVAALDHPNVVWLYDRGVVSAEAAAASGGGLAEGTPWFAMELAEGGTLQHRMASLDWPALRAILEQLLAALAHAHAHGVVHRDIKPPNVLLAGDRVVLSDFGIAWALEHREDRPLKPGLTAGTPSYMAPEQILERVAAQGPWTDLYAVGCVAYHAIAGRSPFRRKDATATMRAHLYEPLPPLVPRFPVPASLWTWLGRMTQKDPTLRFRFAADAARSLPGADEGDHPAMEPDEEESISSSEADTVTRVRALAGPQEEAPPVPETWRRDAVDRPGRLAGAGLGLYGLRAVPIVGRIGERDRLWSALREVAGSRRPRLVVVEGPAGTGKSRLAAWLGERAHEVGAAHVLRAGHQPDVGASDGFAGLLERELRCRGLSRDEVVARVHEGLGALGLNDPDDARFLVEILRPSGATEGGDAGATQERVARLRRFLQARGRDRAVVLWIDDAQWGTDALQLVRAWLDHPEPLPLLAVATVQPESLGADAAALLDSLATRPDVERIGLGAVPEDDREALIHELLPLEPALAARVRERTAGNPLFAVQVLGDWVQRGLLEPGPRGFRLAGDAEPLPHDVVEVWGARVAELTRRRPPADRLALELAATLGVEVDGAEWREACGEAGVNASPDLVGALVARRLATADPEGGWAFVHGMLREAVLEEARRGGRLLEHHLSCAAALAQLGGRDADARRGRHLRLGGRPREALEPLLQAARRRQDGDGRAAEALYREVFEAADAAGLGQDDPFRLRAEAASLKVSFMRGRDAEGFRIYAEVTRRCGDAHEAIRAEAALNVATGLLVRGRLDEGARYATEAYDLAVPAGAGGTAGIAACALADAALRRGRFDESVRWFRTALVHAEAAGAEHAQLNAWFGLAWVALERQELDAVAEPAARARVLAEKTSSRALLARLVNLEGEVARFQGRRADARRLYAEAGRRLASIGAVDACYGPINQGILCAEEGAWAEAAGLFAEGLARAEQVSDRFAAMAARCGLAACHAGEPDERFQPHAFAGPIAAQREGVAIADLADLTERAGQRALEAGFAERACQLFEIAARQLRQLGQTARAEILEARLRVVG